MARLLWRTWRVCEHLATGGVIGLYAALRTRTRQQPGWLPRTVRWWHGRLVRALDIEVRITGTLEPNCLLVGNHVSWLDIPLLGAQGEIGFLAKSEVRCWPLIGWLAEIAGTRFIVRGAHRSEAVVQQILGDLEAGRTIMFFPEGTTTDGRTLGCFHPRLFAIVQAPGVRMQPVAIHYRRRDTCALDLSVPYIGDDSLIANLARLIRHPGLIAHIQFLPPIHAKPGEPRRALAGRARHAISETLAIVTETAHPVTKDTVAAIHHDHDSPSPCWLEPEAA